MDKLGVEKVDRVVLAGAFGAHISPEARDDPRHDPRLSSSTRSPRRGNAAGTGARIALLQHARRGDEIEATVRAIHKVETAIEPRFQEHFVAA